LLFFNLSAAQEGKSSSVIKKLNLSKESKYYSYWNPYRRKLDGQNSRDFFISMPFYEVKTNKNNKIKTVTKYDTNGIKVDTWNLRWNKKGTRSEYKLTFHQSGSITRLDSLIFSHKLSEVKPGWTAKVKSKKDGRPSRFDIYDENGIRYYFYRFHYKKRSDSIISVETIQSSYFRSDSTLVGRHLLFMENGEWLREIHYKTPSNEISEIVKYDFSIEKEETIKKTFDNKGREIESRILQLSYPDKYSYRFDWKPDTIMVVEEIIIKEDTAINYISPVLVSSWYGLPLVYESSLDNEKSNPTFGFFFAPRGNMIIKGKKYSLGLEVVSYNIPIKDTTTIISGVGAFAATQYNLNTNFDWIPQNMEAAIRFGGGMLDNGYGVTFSGSFGYHFLPTRFYLGIYAQSIFAFNEIEEESITGWASIGLSLGANVGDINPDLLKPYKDKLDQEAIFFSLMKEFISKSNVTLSIDNPTIIDTIISELYFDPNSFNSFNIESPFSLILGPFDFNLIFSYLKYGYESKKSYKPDFYGNAYFIGTNVVLDRFIPYGGNSFGKALIFELGSFHTGFGFATGFELNYKFTPTPFHLTTYGKIYAMPYEEIFSGWFSLGFGVGIDFEKLFFKKDKKIK